VHPQEIAIVKALVPVAWADGEYSSHEREMMEGLLAAYHATEEEKERILRFATEKRTLDDIDLQELSAEDRRVLLQHAVLLTFADGVQRPIESRFLGLLAERLKISSEEANEVIHTATERAKKLLRYL
jgi:uncharacterized tellurite resistance protein B-like protein